MTHRIAESAVGGGAATVTATDAETYAEYAEYLTHNGWIISYAEWFKIMAALLVGILILKNLAQGLIWMYRKFRR